MEIQTYNAELAIANLMFKQQFNNIIIQRSDAKGNQKSIHVMCVNGQKSRIFKNWQNAEKKSMYKLPLIIISRTGYSRQPNRVNNIHNEVKYEMTSKYRSYDLMTPIPIDISYDVTIVSKYPTDIDQIASNFMIFYNSDIYVSCRHPKYEGIMLNNQIVMSDSVSEENLDEISPDADDLITTTFQFTFKTYLFGGNKTASKKQRISVLSSYDKDIIKELDAKSAIQYATENPDAFLSVTEKQHVTEQVEVLSNNISGDIYDGLVPTINTFDVRFYPTPHLCSHAEYIDAVDNKYLDETYDICAIISDDIPEVIGKYGTLYPYVDRMKWIIDSDIQTNDFPGLIWNKY